MLIPKCPQIIDLKTKTSLKDYVACAQHTSPERKRKGRLGKQREGAESQENPLVRDGSML